MHVIIDDLKEQTKCSAIKMQENCHSPCDKQGPSNKLGQWASGWRRAQFYTAIKPIATFVLKQEASQRLTRQTTMRRKSSYASIFCIRAHLSAAPLHKQFKVRLKMAQRPILATTKRLPSTTTDQIRWNYWNLQCWLKGRNPQEKMPAARRRH